jgi:hypothetical protein
LERSDAKKQTGGGIEDEFRTVVLAGAAGRAVGSGRAASEAYPKRENVHVSSGLEQRQGGKVLAERGGFEPPIQVLARITV